MSSETSAMPAETCDASTVRNTDAAPSKVAEALLRMVIPDIAALEKTYHS